MHKKSLKKYNITLFQSWSVENLSIKFKFNKPLQLGILKTTLSHNDPFPYKQFGTALNQSKQGRSARHKSRVSRVHRHLSPWNHVESTTKGIIICPRNNTRETLRE